jgi:hypothetical protein
MIVLVKRSRQGFYFRLGYLIGVKSYELLAGTLNLILKPFESLISCGLRFPALGLGVEIGEFFVQSRRADASPYGSRQILGGTHSLRSVGWCYVS